MYTLEWVASPNFTPASQSKAVYGKPRTLDFGAGHWWGDPNAGYSHQGVINTFLNPARQASAHAVVSAGRVTEMVRQSDIAWATNNANPFTFAIEVDPRMHLGGELARQIKETLCEYIADKGFHNLQWYPHNHWKATQCNPLPWGEIMQRAKEIWQEKYAPKPVQPEWKQNLRAISGALPYIAIDDSTPLRNLGNPAEVIKNYTAGTAFEIAAETWVGGHRYLLSRYSYENGIASGFDEYELRELVPPQPAIPEWQRNLVDIEPIKLMAMWPDVGVYNLNSMEVITTLPKGTWVDFQKKTTVKGVDYLISSYSAQNALPNGIKAELVGIPVEPPVQEKPEWLEQWLDIADKDMYTRGVAQLVDLLTGETLQALDPNTKVRVVSATFWHGQQYFLITEEGQAPQGIAVVSLDDAPTEKPDQPAEPAPEQPPIIERTNWFWRIILFVIRLFSK